MEKNVVMILVILSMIGLASATVDNLGTFKKNTTIELKQLCSNCTYNNISSISYPNSSILIRNQNMTKDYSFFNYSLNWSYVYETGTYLVTGIGDENGVPTQWSYTFEVTENGRELPTDNVKVFFFIAFLLLLGLSCFLTIYTIGHFTILDFDIIDLSVDWGILFVIVGVLNLEKYYLGNPMIDDYFTWFISIGIITLGLVPILALIFSLIVGGLVNQKVTFNVPQKLKFR